MELTKRELALLATARKNPAVTERAANLVLASAIVLAGGTVLFEVLAPPPFDWNRLLLPACWLAIGSLLRDQKRFEVTALSLIAKLDGSYREALPPPQTLGLSRSDDQA